MAKQNKTTINDGNVLEFMANVENEQRRNDGMAMLDIMGDITGEDPFMYGKSIVGFGSYRYRYETGREGDWFQAGFSPRKGALTLYISSGFEGHDELMDKLGKFKTGKSCLYIKKLTDVDETVLRELIKRSGEYVIANSVE